MTRCFSLFLSFFWAMMVAWGALHMLHLKSFEGGMVKVTLAIVVISIITRKLKFIPFDFLVLVYCCYVLVSYAWFPLPSNYFVMAIQNQIYPISMFYIARLSYISPENFLDKMRIPLLFAFVCALYLYFFSPSWYVSYRATNWAYEYVGDQYYERMRLSGFWPWSYFIGYSSLFLIMYDITRRVAFKEKKAFFLITMIISCLTLFFAQQRVSIAYLGVFALLVYFFFSDKKPLKFSKKLVCVIASSLFLCTIVGFFIVKNLDTSFIEYVLNRSFHSNSNVVGDRVGLYEGHLSDISLLGDGLGSHSHTMRNYRLSWSITDCDYIRILKEFGIIGSVILALILLVPLFQHIKYVRKLFFEYNVVLFLLVAMIGATPLEHLPLHPYMYWFCLGKIAVYSEKKLESHL